MVGEVYATKKFGKAEVIGYKNSKEVTVRFLNTGTVKIVSL